MNQYMLLEGAVCHPTQHAGTSHAKAHFYVQTRPLGTGIICDEVITRVTALSLGRKMGGRILPRPYQRQP